jgi:hypothetical protein
MCKKSGLPCIECFIKLVIRAIIRPVADKLGAHMQEVEKAINGLRLPKDFKWFKLGVGFTCKARDVGLGSFAECLEKDSFMCPFSVSFDGSYYCKCFPRVYIASELKK